MRAPFLCPDLNPSSDSIFANWSMTCWLLVERRETTLGFAINSCCVVSDRMLTSILSVSVEFLEMFCAEATVALAPPARDLEPEDLRSPFILMCAFKRLNLSWIQFCLIS